MDATVDWALMISRDTWLNDLDEHLARCGDSAGRPTGPAAAADGAVVAAFGPVRFNRLYYGNEFCERLVPRRTDAQRAYEAARSRDLGFSLLTTYVTNEGLARCRPLLDLLARHHDPRIEVIVNDWGLLRLMRREFPDLRPVVGRLMNKMLRDPRLANLYARAEAPAPVREALRQSTLTVPAYRAFLSRSGVTRVEFDNLPQGLDMDFRRLAVSASLYLPYGYVTTGRICCSGSLGLSRAEKFRVDRPCRRECQTLRFRFPVGEPASSDGEPFLIEQGNTFFYTQDPLRIAMAAVTVQRLGVDRIVYQPRIPV